MTKKARISIALFAAVILILTAAVRLLPGCAPASAEPAVPQVLEPFENIRLEVKSADVVLRSGTDFSITSSLHGREKLTRLEVADGTLYFDTGYEKDWGTVYGDWLVEITVPEDAVLDTLEITSIAGDISVDRRSFTDGVFATTAGDIVLEAIRCDTLELKSVSGDLELKDSSVARTVLADTVSGSITAGLPLQSFTASTVGTITVNGERFKRSCTQTGGQPSLEAVSVSGSISIETDDAGS